MAKDKVRKPVYKKWWFWLLAIIIIIALTQCGDEEANNNETSNENAQTDETTNNGVKGEETNNERDNKDSAGEEETDTKINAGVYKIGSDIPAGEYLVFANGAGYIESASDSTGQLESIIFNDNLASGGHTYVTLNEGEYFKLQGADMYPVDSAPSIIPEDGLYENGMFKVGQDIPAGEYKVILDSAIGMGYLEVSKDSRHQIDSIVTNENVQSDMYITISDGQYVKLQDVQIQK
ncbi:hypothetical protein PZE06_14785 [Robertmurraya sp. DFI.2.37]|uniref:hypothetical protein n=1 Tax=Robertmurraya sp. DFI.2.37 TaxID=3031819 RepID=UPI0012442F3B|nr:hypothetical protein [Robertmurraya sp. DFI.2.37]MDF1509413.1 hypothetical protein [Robertmurraya sp. DFI.2.37]